jgi:hypothetical protein
MAFKDHPDVAHFLVNTLDLILSITDAVYKVAGSRLEASEKKYDKDMFTLCTLAIDNGIIDTVSILLDIVVTISEAKLILDAAGNITIAAESINDVTSIKHTKLQSPTPAMQQAMLLVKAASLTSDLADIIVNAGVSIYGFTDKGKGKDPEKL